LPKLDKPRGHYTKWNESNIDRKYGLISFVCTSFCKRLNLKVENKIAVTSGEGWGDISQRIKSSKYVRWTSQEI
jgi:hypothetical protein